MGQYGPYALCGWRVLSDLPMPELLLWESSGDASRELRLEIGQVPFDTTDSAFTWSEECGATLRVPQVAAFHMNAEGNQVAIEPQQGADLLLVRGFLYGSVLAMLCYKHGFLPLHGASVLLDGAAVILSGPSGAGKSTLAAALTQRGHPLLSDDVCAIDLRDRARPLLWPAFPRVKLLPDAIEALQLGPSASSAYAAVDAKAHFAMTDPKSPEAPADAVPITAIYGLAAPGGDRVRATPMQGKEAFAFLDSQAHRKWMGRKLGLGEQLFRQICMVASAVPAYWLERPCGVERIGEIASLLETAHAARCDGAGTQR